MVQTPHKGTVAGSTPAATTTGYIVQLMTPAQLADIERMHHAIYVIGCIPYLDPVPWGTYEKRNHVRQDRTCRKDKEPWPCKAALRQLNAHTTGVSELPVSKQ